MVIIALAAYIAWLEVADYLQDWSEDPAVGNDLALGARHYRRTVSRIGHLVTVRGMQSPF
jgi:hypothetical protein